MGTSAVPQKQRPSFCAQSLVLKLLEVISFLVLELVEVFCLLLLFFIEHCGFLEEVLVDYHPLQAGYLHRHNEKTVKCTAMLRVQIDT